MLSALLIRISKLFNALLINPPQHPPDSIQTFIQIRERRTEREPDEVVAWRVEKVTTVIGVDVEEYSGDHDRMLFEQLFEERLERKTHEIS